MSVIVVCNLKSRLFHSTLQNLTSYHIEKPDNLQTVWVLGVLNYCFAKGDYGLSENIIERRKCPKSLVVEFEYFDKILCHLFCQVSFPTGGGRREEVI